LGEPFKGSLKKAMAWQFRTSFSPLPGVRLTLSPRGISTSVGAGPLRVGSGSHGAAITGRIAGTWHFPQHSLHSLA